MTIDPALDAELERRGVKAIQALLQMPIAAGPAEGSPVEGLLGPDGKRMNRSYVEGWLRRKEEERHLQEESDRRWIKIAALAAIVAAVIALGAWLFPVR
jgi:hypothetical protein